MSVLLESSDVADRHLHSSLGAQNTSRLHGDQQTVNESPFRPSFHLIAPNGWQNDPCGLGYDPKTGLYHCFVQWNPYGNDWGNMSWGHATSPDLVSWDMSPIPALVPTEEYDKRGVFTGCLRPTGPCGESGVLTTIYTSVSHLPIHFTLPYTTGCESLSIATSQNGGKSWERQDCNPILPGPPEGLSVTGWRDPCLAPWARESSNISDSRPDLHGFISGGVKGQYPTVFVYTVNSQNIRQWNYVGPLVNVGLNFSPSRWSGDFGVNWEVANFLTLANDAAESRDFVVMGVEGCLRPEIGDHNSGEARHRRDPRGQMWMSVKSNEGQTNTSDALATYSFAGFFDHGCLYAANSFWDPETSQHIVFGWVTEEDLPDGPRHRQGWSGMVSLPRAVKLVTLRNVTKARHSPLKSITSIEAVESSEDTGFTVHTLGISPDARLSSLRKRAQHSHITNLSLSEPSESLDMNAASLYTSKWELQAEFSVGKTCQSVGIEIAHSSSKSSLRIADEMKPY